MGEWDGVATAGATRGGPRWSASRAAGRTVARALLSAAADPRAGGRGETGRRMGTFGGGRPGRASSCPVGSARAARVRRRRALEAADVVGGPVAAVLALEGLRGGADEHGGRAADDDEGDDPAEDGRREELAVDAAEALEEADGDGRADLAVGRREGPALGRAVDDDEGGAELDAVAAGRGDGRRMSTPMPRMADGIVNPIVAGGV